MRAIESLNEFKEMAQRTFQNNQESLDTDGVLKNPHLKAYLLESNHKDISDASSCPLGQWKALEDSRGWFTNIDTDNPYSFFIDTTDDRVWRLYSFLDVKRSDVLVNEWITHCRGMDYCWLSREQLLHWNGQDNWEERGIGIRYADGLAPADTAGNFSLKAWHGAGRHIEGLNELLEKAKETFAIHSIRWQKKSGNDAAIITEWYSNGKVTISKGNDIDEVLATVSEMAIRYKGSLLTAARLRDSKMGAFELNFTQQIDLDAFTLKVLKGVGDMRLWLVELEHEPDFRRFKGVDLHNWDRVFLDVGIDYAYLTIPKKGCVNAAPRIAAIQGEDNSGKTQIYYDGVKIFD